MYETTGDTKQTSSLDVKWYARLSLAQKLKNYLNIGYKAYANFYVYRRRHSYAS